MVFETLVNFLRCHNVVCCVVMQGKILMLRRNEFKYLAVMCYNVYRILSNN